MGKDTKIEWAHHTFNGWWGCTKVSEACRHCYAESMAKRTGHAVWGADAERRPLSDNNWRQPLKWDRSARKRGVVERVFCASMSDVFEDRRDLDEHRERLWDLIRQTTNLRWLLLTKRPENIAAMLPADLVDDYRIWIGTTVEDKKTAEERIHHLVNLTAVVRFVSCEPLLQAVSLYRVLRGAGLDWVIVGGESGGGARPMYPAWVRQIRDECLTFGVPFLFKQWGAFRPSVIGLGSVVSRVVCCCGASVKSDESPAFGDHVQFGGHVCGTWIGMQRVGKKDAGRILDGRTWDEVPE